MGGLATLFNWSTYAVKIYWKVHVYWGVKEILDGTIKVKINEDHDEGMGWLDNTNVWHCASYYLYDDYSEEGVREEWTFSELLEWACYKGISEVKEAKAKLKEEWDVPEHIYFQLPLGRAHNPAFDLMTIAKSLKKVASFLAPLISELPEVAEDMIEEIIDLDFITPVTENLYYWDETEEDPLVLGSDFEEDEQLTVHDFAVMRAYALILEWLSPLIKKLGILGLKIIKWLITAVFKLVSGVAKMVRGRLKTSSLIESIDESLDDEFTFLNDLVEPISEKFLHSYSPQKGITLF